MRFLLIQRLKDGKILFEFVDEIFKQRAEKNAAIAANENSKVNYKINKMSKIFQPCQVDFMNKIESPRSNEEV